MRLSAFTGSAPAAVVALVIGALVGLVLARALATCDYRLEEEKVFGDGRPRPRPFHPGVVIGGCALLWGVLVWRFGDTAGWTLLPPYLVLATFGVALLWIDVDVHRLPRGLTLPLLPTVLVLLVLPTWVTGDWAALRRAVIVA